MLARLKAGEEVKGNQDLTKEAHSPESFVGEVCHTLKKFVTFILFELLQSRRRIT